MLYAFGETTTDEVYPDMPAQPFYSRYGKDKRKQEEHGADFIRIRLRAVENIPPHHAVGCGKHHDNYQDPAEHQKDMTGPFNDTIDFLLDSTDQLPGLL